MYPPVCVSTRVTGSAGVDADCAGTTRTSTGSANIGTVCVTLGTSAAGATTFTAALDTWFGNAGNVSSAAMRQCWRGWCRGECPARTRAGGAWPWRPAQRRVEPGRTVVFGKNHYVLKSSKRSMSCSKRFDERRTVVNPDQ